jgi:hypothetical protein
VASHAPLLRGQRGRAELRYALQPEVMLTSMPRAFEANPRATIGMVTAVRERQAARRAESSSLALAAR